MKTLSRFGPFLLALTLPTHALAQESSGIQPPAETYLPDTAVVYPIDHSGGHGQVEVMFEGKGPYRMILDTGASVTVLDKDFAEELGLEVLGQTRIGDPTDPAALLVDRVAIPEIALGDAFFYDMRAVAWERPAALQRKRVRGILGLPTFGECLLTLDYRKNELRIENGKLPPANGRDIIAIDTSDGVVSFPLEIDGETFTAVLDSGNPSNLILPQRLMEKMDVVAGSQRKGQGSMVNSSIEFTTARITNQLSLGSYKLKAPVVSFGSSLQRINLGRVFLQEALVTLDLAHGRMQVRAHKQPAGQ